jgi:hypothetical protein
VLARRQHAVYGTKIAVVNAGIGGNQIVGPAEYTPQKPFPGGPSAKDRLDRDMLSLSGIAAVVWLEGINDFSKNGNAIRAARGARGRSDSVPRPQLPIACRSALDHRRSEWPVSARSSRLGSRITTAELGGNPTFPIYRL